MTNKVLFIDIETVPITQTYQELSPRLKPFWDKKAKQLGATSREEIERLFRERAGIFAEFGKIVAIAIGYEAIVPPKPKPAFHVKGMTHRSEFALLKEFTQTINKFPKHQIKLCAHNGKEFDFPYLSRRLLINQIPIPAILDHTGKKPWEVPHLDTMELWKFGDYKSYTSLDLLAALFEVPSSKHIMDGSQVADYYYNEKKLAEIKSYCVEDVIVTAQIYKKYNLEQPYQEEDIKRIL